jgi:hypothetical protein
MTRRASAALLLLALAGCGGANECDRCSSDDDCRSGLVCAQFNDENRRCVIDQPEITSCRDR